MIVNGIRIPERRVACCFIFDETKMSMAQKTGRKSSWASLAIVVVLLIALLLVKTCRHSQPDDRDVAETGKTKTGKGLNRSPSQINYSNHARCRMGCRHISEAEVKDILTNGDINYRKSELDGAECKKRYAVEGTTNDNQRVRIIFAPCQTEVTVVTVIDIGKEWPCDCQ